MDRTLPIATAAVLVVIGIFATLITLGASIDAGVGTGIGALLFIGLTAAAILA